MRLWQKWILSWVEVAQGLAGILTFGLVDFQWVLKMAAVFAYQCWKWEHKDES